MPLISGAVNSLILSKLNYSSHIIAVSLIGSFFNNPRHSFIVCVQLCAPTYVELKMLAHSDPNQACAVMGDMADICEGKMIKILNS